MSYALFLDLDQQRIEQQDAIAEDLRIAGFTDAVEGNKPESDQETPYLMGYLEGLKHLQLEIRLAAQLLDFEGRRLEQAVGILEEF